MPQESPPAEVLRVALPMLTLVPGGMGGSEVYAEELVRQLAVDPRVDLRTAVPRSAAGRLGHPAEHVATRITGAPGARARLVAQGRAVTDRSVRRWLSGAEVVHYPFSVPVPPARSAATVVTIHDVQHRDLPHLFSSAERAYRRLTYERAARRADRVITISEFSRERIVDLLQVDPGRIHVAHLAVDASRFLANRGPRERFVLYPARGWPHKNHATLVEAVRRARSRMPGLRLVLTGGDLARLGSLPSWVEVLGLVPRPHLLELYRSAACLAFPSRYEGFGLPPLEAMASGCPVAAARRGSLPEVCGDAAVFFDPDDADDVARAILTAIDDETLPAAGLERVRAFTWEACADAHVAAYRAATGVRPSRSLRRDGGTTS